MKIRFGKSIIDGSDAPIAIFLTAEERANVAKMPEGTAILCDYPKEQYTEEEINKWLGVKGVGKGPVQKSEPRPLRCVICGEKIKEGSAICVDEDGDPLHLYCAKIGTMRDGEVKFSKGDDLELNHEENDE